MGMPFWMCAGSRVAFLVSAACAGVIFWYVLIAVEWFRPIIRRGLVEPELKVLSSLVAVFLACSFCGYGFRIVSNWYPNYWLLLGGLVLLNFCSAYCWVSLKLLGARNLMRTMEVGAQTLSAGDELTDIIDRSEHASKTLRELAAELRNLV
ncbi:MAG: hypothetical protein R3E01_11615 [Pirellulaceae bacterium]